MAIIVTVTHAVIAALNVSFRLGMNSSCIWQQCVP